MITLRNGLSLYFAQLHAASKVSFADRSTTALQILGILFNNGFAVVLWIMFFAGFNSVGGWRLPDVSLLLGMLGITFGVAGVLFGGHSDMASTIIRREIDPYLVQPNAILPRILVRRSIAASWGDLLTGTILLTVAANLHWNSIGALIVVLFSCQTIYISTAVTYGSLAFWTMAAPGLARDLLSMLGLLSTFPSTIYAGLSKVLIYTVLPAGLIVLLPMSFVRNPTSLKLAALIAASIAYAALASFTFRCGLQRYIADQVSSEG